MQWGGLFCLRAAWRARNIGKEFAGCRAASRIIGTALCSCLKFIPICRLVSESLLFLGNELGEESAAGFGGGVLAGHGDGG